MTSSAPAADRAPRPSPSDPFALAGIDAPGSPPAPDPRPAAVDASRRFGAHARMAWWKPLVILVPMGVLMLVGQIVLMTIAMIAEVLLLGRDPEDYLTIGPLMLLSVNLSLVLAAALGVLLMVLVGRVPLRSVLAHPRRVRWGRLGICAAVFAVPLALVLVVPTLLDPSVKITITGTTIAFLAVALLTTPLQAAAEELMFRGVMTPAIAAWIRPERIALAVGIALSSLIFGLSHGAGDPWLFAYYVIFGLSAALMALISRGLEAPIAFHVVNNVIAMALGAVIVDGGGLVIDRSAGSGGPFMLVMIGVDLFLVAIVWLLERRRAGAKAAAAVGAGASPSAPVGAPEPRSAD